MVNIKKPVKVQSPIVKMATAPKAVKSNGVTKSKKAERGSTASLIGLSLSIFVLLQSPTHTMLTSHSSGENISKPLSPLEVSALVGAELIPAITPAFRALLFTGTVVKEASKVLLSCMGTNGACDWTRVGHFNRLWQETVIGEQAQDEWRKAAGNHYGILSAACAVVTLAGLGCFIVPVKMVFVGLILMVVILYYTHTCSILPNLMFMSFLGGMMLLGEHSMPPPKKNAATSESETLVKKTSEKANVQSKDHLYAI